jgi:nucleoid-associated protein YgaU
MVKLLKIRMGVADDPTALQPSLNDCLEAMLQQARPLMTDVLQALEVGTASSGPRRIPGFQRPGVKQTVEGLARNVDEVCKTFETELTRLVYLGGGKDQVQAETLRFEDLNLFGDDQLDQSIEVARAQQEVAGAVDDTLPGLDALISTMLGWRTIQPGLNPLRPEVFVRSLQHTLSIHVPDNAVREALITPSAGLLGVQLRKLYREIADWLRSTGVEPAVPIGGRIAKGSGAQGSSVNDSVARTLLTLDRLRKLLAGDFDQPKAKPDFLHTVPASMAMLQDMQQVDVLVQRLEKRPPKAPPPSDKPVDMLEDKAEPAGPAPRIGQQLGEEVVRLMFDNLAQDTRLLPGFKRQLKGMEPAVHRLAGDDSRFFSDRNHPARQLLDRITQRSLAFGSEQDEGWARFMTTVESARAWLDSKVVDAETFDELLENLQEQWSDQDQHVKQRREDAARALLHAEQRNLLAQRLGAEFAQLVEGIDVADFFVDFLKNSWAQVIAESQLSCTDGSSDPFGYRALVDDLIWSVQKTSAQRGRARRLVQMIPGLLTRLREGLHRIGYPPELTQRFFDNLITLHRAAVQEGRDAAAEAAADAAWNEQGQFVDSGADEVQMWLDANEAKESGFVPEEEIDLDFVTSPAAAGHEAKQAEREKAAQAAQAAQKAEFARQAAQKAQAARAADADGDETEPPAQTVTAEDADTEPPEAAVAPQMEDLRMGSWVEIHIKGEWVRAQLTWASPHATLFMFTSISGNAHSMSRRTLDKLRALGQLKIVADRPVVDEALDQVAQRALKNSLDTKA